MRALRLCLVALALGLGACGAAYVEEPMETEVVLVQQPQQQQVIVADPNDPFAVPPQQQQQPQVVQQPGPQVVQVQPQPQPQIVQVHQPQPQGPRIVSGPQPQNTACTNTCRYANDRECDDGRPGAHTSLCAYGSDCNDCGPG